jgi:hypothetical protein
MCSDVSHASSDECVCEVQSPTSVAMEDAGGGTYRDT